MNMYLIYDKTFIENQAVKLMSEIHVTVTLRLHCLTKKQIYSQKDIMSN